MSAPSPRPRHIGCLIWDIGLNIGSKKNPDGISKSWLVCFSEQERGIEHCLCNNDESLEEELWIYLDFLSVDLDR